MTIHEAKLIQTFPEDYVISGSWGEAMRQIGNAVPVALAEKIGQSVLSALQGEKTIAPVCEFRRSKPEQLRLALEKRRKGKAAKSAKAKKSVKACYKRKPTDG